MEIPATAPVMILGGASLFPHAMLPLRIFEPRYRAMLRHALEHDRVLCIAMIRPGVEEWRDERDFHEVAGLGLVRACVGQDDGTSNLVLQGLARVRFAGYPQRKPFVVARIEEILTEKASAEEGEPLARKARELCLRFKERGIELPPQLDRYLAQIEEPGVLADVIANTFVGDAEERQRLLEQPADARRLRMLVRYLARELK